MKKRKLRSRRGESIAETLVSVLIMALAFLMLAGAVVTAARINERVKNDDVALSHQSADPAPQQVAVTVTLDGGAAQTYTVQQHSDNGYYYYDEPSTDPAA